MSVNKHRPHVYVIPEDRRNAQIANGFAQHPRVNGQIRVMREAGGWRRVFDTFQEEYLPLLHQNANTHVVLLIDFDGSPEDRRERSNADIPDGVRPRVFVIGPRDTPETLRQSLGRGYEDIGRALANECDGQNLDAWTHEQLQHNEHERIRLVNSVRPFLFSDC